MAPTGPDALERYREAAAGCSRGVFWRRMSLAGTFAELAETAATLGIDDIDRYGEGGAVARLESEVAELLGKPAAVFVPSGTMAQQAVLRVWCEETGSRRVALPQLSHLIDHEADGPRLLHDLRLEHLTTGRRVPLAADLEAIPGPLGAILTELPLRDAGCVLPTWEELTELGRAARERGVPLHLDGARIWEAQPFYDRPLAEIVEHVDSVYVSLYKGLGALSGAVVAGPADVMDQLRTWRKRMGGTLFVMSPYALGGLRGLRTELPRMADYLATARALGEAFTERGLRVHPAVPQTCTFEVYADGSAEEVNLRLAEFMERTGVQLSGPWRQTDDPGTVVVELACYADSTTYDPAEVADWFMEVVA